MRQMTAPTLLLAATLFTGCVTGGTPTTKKGGVDCGSIDTTTDRVYGGTCAEEQKSAALKSPHIKQNTNFALKANTMGSYAFGYVRQ